MIDLWHKNAVIYSLDVETFMDGNGDGVGDFEGLTSQIDYLAGLGVTCLWLLPFHPSPNRDNGYDVTDYYGVDPRLGTPGDFVEFARAARERGIRILTDLVVNHTSDEHPWFRQARSDPRSKYRDWYVWSKTKPKDVHKGIAFPGFQKSIWSYDEVAGLWYHHRFYEFQPDLNMENDEVRREVLKIMGFWLELGVSGFRVDAAPFLVQLWGSRGEEEGERHAFLKEMRDLCSWRRGDTILLAEANVTPDEVPNYVGDGDMLQMLFNFVVNQRLFLAFAREDPEPIVRALKSLPPLPAVAQWANFLRLHDELDLGRLSEAERREVFRAFGPEERMQLYGRGLRRRLPPMLGGDARKVRLALSLLLTLPGTPVIEYGEEIGMGEDLSLPERQSVRTPMQWSAEPNGGFSTTAADRLVRPVISGGDFGYERVNVADQRRDPDSLLNWMERAIRMRKECPEFGWGQYRVIETGARGVLAHCCLWKRGTVVAVHNLTGRKETATLDLTGWEARALIDLLGNRGYRRLEGATYPVELDGYGFRWFRVDRPQRH
jgi:maltose alpha-D-glucosyltransferase/alpha-amylase